MNAKSLILVAASVAAFAGAARADDITIDPVKFESTRTRAEVQAEAAKVYATRSVHPAGSLALVVPKSSMVNVQALRAETVQAVRSGQIPRGEISHF
jgi:hypothetical protein